MESEPRSGRTPLVSVAQIAERDPTWAGAISHGAVYDGRGAQADKGADRRIGLAGSPARYED